MSWPYSAVTVLVICSAVSVLVTAQCGVMERVTSFGVNERVTCRGVRNSEPSNGASTELVPPKSKNSRVRVILPLSLVTD